MGFGAIPASRSTMAVRAVQSWMAPRCSEAHCLGACKSSMYSPQNWTRTMWSPWLLAFLYPRFQVHMYRQSPSRPLRPRSFQAAKKSPARSVTKGRKVQEFRTVQSSDVKYIEWWRVKVNDTPTLLFSAADRHTFLHGEVVSFMLIFLRWVWVGRWRIAQNL